MLEILHIRLDHNTMYFGVVSVWDRLQNERKCLTNGVLFDATPPNMTLARLNNPLAFENGEQRIAHLIQVKVEGIVDPESGVREYLASLGTLEKPQGVLAFLSVGTYEGSVLMGGLLMEDGPT